MALINCPHCGNTISNKALHCPHCGAPIAAQQYHQPNVMPEQKKNSSFLPWLLVGILATILAGVGIYFLLSNSNKESDDTERIAMNSQTDVETQDSVPEMTVETPSEVTKDNSVEEDAHRTIPDPQPAPQPVEERVINSNSDGHDMGFNSRKHHHLVGYMTDNLGDHAIELDFNCNNGQVSDVVYKNVKYGGKIHMQCTSFSSNSISLLGKDGSKTFTMDLNFNDYGHFSGDAMVGDKYLSVTLNTSCSHN